MKILLMVAIALVYTMVNITEANEIRIPDPKPDTMYYHSDSTEWYIVRYGSGLNKMIKGTMLLPGITKNTIRIKSSNDTICIKGPWQIEIMERPLKNNQM